MSASVPGSCPPNWLQGNPSISSPWSLYLSYTSCNPLYCGVKPHLLATFTIRSAFPS